MWKSLAVLVPRLLLKGNMSVRFTGQSDRGGFPSLGSARCPSVQPAAEIYSDGVAK